MLRLQLRPITHPKACPYPNIFKRKPKVLTDREGPIEEDDLGN